MSIRSRLRRGFTLIEVMTAVVILIILMALAVGVLSGAGKARMNNAVFDVAAMISAAQMRAVSSGTPHYILIHWPPQRGSGSSYLRVHMLERPDEPGPGGFTLDWNALNLDNGPEAALAFQPTGAATATNASNRGTVGLGVGTGSERRDVAFLDLDSQRVRGLLRPPFNTISLNTAATASPLDLPSDDLMVGCNFCVNPAGDEPYGVLRFNADGTMQVMTNAINARTGAAIAFVPNTDDEQGVTPRLLVVAAPAGATVVY
ncbi:MAG TPA: prepilin-type N-terminal cleavage/methylation domain-containing protein [Hyalangium sp.]|nr:prepilin-type N-terminal cleavage/methylation domain-containing protein [Hyalangium sp.]